MRLNIIQVYFVFYLLITILRGFMNFPVPAGAAPSGTNFTANAETLAAGQTNGSIVPAEPDIPRYTYSIPEYAVILIVDIIALIGIFGAGFKKEIFFPMFWKVFLFIFCIVEAYVIYRSSWNSTFWVFVWSLTMILPAPYAIFGYGFTFRWAEYEKRRNNDDSD
jgi:hypothetical protein